MEKQQVLRIKLSDYSLKLKVSKKTTISQLKQIIFKKTKIEPLFQRIIGLNHSTEDEECPLGVLNLQPNHHITVTHLSKEEIEKKMNRIPEIVSDPEIDEDPENVEDLVSLEMISDVTPPLLDIEYVQEFTHRLKKISEEPFEEFLQNRKISSKLVVLYFHEINNEKSENFFEHKFLDRKISVLLNENFLLWMGGIDENFSNKNELKELLNIKEFPVMCVFDNSTESFHIDTLHSTMDVDSIIANLLHRRVEYNPGTKKQLKPRLSRKTSSRTLRKIQDLEYEIAMNFDKEKERLHNLVEEDIQREEIEKKLFEKSKLSKKEKAQKSLPQEPDQGTENVAKIKIRKQNNEIIYRFLGTEKLKILFTLVESKFPELGNYQLSSNYPRLALSSNSENLENQTLQEAGLVPQAMFFIRELD
ncbi:fas-associated factor 2 [Anaeramoeba flamelloides]|uniref:Fas-associated factor 2 n=1 Tax=Anaeramoeba flamelloides TaxID=1746091 RepID=A0ABQ8YV58_9EUKA|nr:fas-associated factor 2 [Anaeramoeba flamelloides]